MLMLAVEQIADFLQEVSIFEDLGREDILQMAKSANVRTYSKGMAISKRNDPANYLYVIYSGRVSEFVVDDNELTCVARPNEKRDYFGELGLLLNEPYHTTSVAASSTDVIRIPKDVFCEIAWNRHRVIRSVLRTLTIRLQKSGEKTISFVNFNAEGRLAYNLLQMRNKQNEVHATQESLSEQCGIVRQTVSSILNGWKRSGSIDIKRGKIDILKAETLADYFMSDQNIR